MTSAQAVETSVHVPSNSPSQEYTHPDDHNLRTYDMTPGFKPRGGGGGLPYMGYTETFRWIGYGFWPLCPEQGI